MDIGLGLQHSRLGLHSSLKCNLVSLYYGAALRHSAGRTSSSQNQLWSSPDTGPFSRLYAASGTKSLPCNCCSSHRVAYTCVCCERQSRGYLVPFPLRRELCYGKKGPSSRSVTCRATRMENLELVVGDVLALLCFALWKQVAAIVAQPDFPGWLAPLSFNPVAIADFASFCLTLVLTWVTSSLLVGGYMGGASKDLPTALRATSMTWLVSMPVILAQLMIVTALKSRALVGEPGFGDILPLAASGPGEPLPSAAGVLGLMVGWRSYYTTNLDWFADVTEDDKRRFQEAVATVILLSGGSIALLQVLYLVLDHETLEAVSASVSFSISEAASSQSSLGV